MLQGKEMAYSCPQRTIGTVTPSFSISLSLSLSLSLSFFHSLSTYNIIDICSGMENLIKSQKEAIIELEAKIQAHMEELKKVCNCQFL